MSLSEISEKFTESTLDEIIQKCGGKKHVSWKFGDGFKKGDSYLSEVYRLIVDGEKEDGSSIQVTMIVKSMPRNIGRRLTFRSTDFFRNECNFYNNILCKMVEFQTSKNIPQKIALTELPKCLAAYSDGKYDFVALEDLCPDGYRSASRQNGLDLAHCEIVMRILGKFHGLSLAIKDQKPEMFKEFLNHIEETYYSEELKWWYNNFAMDQIVCARDTMKKEFGGTIYEERAIKFMEPNKFYDMMVNLTRTTNEFSVLCHGDCWIPNFLIRYSADDKPIESKMIDFQLARHSSPALDISFFIYSCTSHELREEHYDDLLHIYHHSATEIITALGSNANNVYPFNALQDELLKFARFGVGMGIESIPFSIMDEADTPDLDTIEGEVAIPLEKIFIIRPIKSKEGRLRLANMFKHGIDHGYLDEF